MFVPYILGRRDVRLSVIILAVLSFPAMAQARPDLSVQISAPGNAIPGSDIGEKVSILVHNRGTQTAPGTKTRGKKGYMIDLFLTRAPGGKIPAGYAAFNAKYSDGVLLRGGRVSNTLSLAPGQRTKYRSGAGIPADTPNGNYRLCARVDPGNAVRERNEKNNLACAVIKIAQLVIKTPLLTLKDMTPFFGKRLAKPKVLGTDKLRILPKAIQPPKPTGGGKAKRTILADGSIQIEHPDGRIERLRPDGLVETVMPDGTAIVPYAMQVQGAELPPLPDALSPWGVALEGQLLGVLRNILTEAELEAYMQTEAEKDYYEVINWRVRSIGFLTSAE